MHRIMFWTLLLMSLILIFGPAESFADCMLDAEFVDSNGDDNPDIKVTAKGKTASGRLKVINNDETACTVRVSLRVYAGEDNKVAAKSVSFGSIKPGTEAVKPFAITSRFGVLYGQTLVAVLNPTVTQEDGETIEIDDGSITTVIDSPESAPDLTAEWISGPTLSNNNKKITGQLKVTNLATDNSDDAQNVERFAVTFWHEDVDGGAFKRLKKVYINSLKAGDSRTLNFSYSSNQSLLDLRFVAGVDFDNTIYETEETNNVAYPKSSDPNIANAISGDCKLSTDFLSVATSVSFGTVQVGNSVTKTLKLAVCYGRGAGGSTPAVSVFWSGDSGDFKAEDLKGNPGISIDYGTAPGPGYLKITFTPTAPGEQSITLHITAMTTMGETVTRDIILTGTGI